MKSLGMMLKDQGELLTNDVAGLLASEYNVSAVEQPSKSSVLDTLSAPLPDDEDYSKWPLRAPVVTIMGHVDHGKTTLLDRLRKTNVAKAEAGGITQHIGAFSVQLPSADQRRITFLDTPGHAAFTAMRARGSKVTDIVVLVIAADDGIKPQTVEAIMHAKAAQVPLVVAITKCDKPDAQVERVYNQLMEHELQPELFGGDVPCVQLSALTGHGLPELEETLLALAEVMELRGKVDAPAKVAVIESRTAKGRGNVASVLVQHGTLRPGAVLVLGGGRSYCRVRQIVDDRQKPMGEAVPSTPCELLGSWTSLPSAGEEGVEVESEELAKQCVQAYEDYQKQLRSIQDFARVNQQKNAPLDPIQSKLALIEKSRNRLHYLRSINQRGAVNYQLREIARLEREVAEMRKQLSTGTSGDDLTVAESSSGNSQAVSVKDLLVVVKGDVNGSVEAVVGALKNLSLSSSAKRNFVAPADLPAQLETFSTPRQQINVKVLFSGVGPFAQSDIDLLVAAKRAETAGKRTPAASILLKRQSPSSPSPPPSEQQCVLVGFNVAQPPKQLAEVLQRNRIPLVSHNIIYKLMDEVKGLVGGMLTPNYAFEVVGEANVLNIFAISGGKEIIAGCRVISGSLVRSVGGNSGGGQAQKSPAGAEAKYRVLRNGVKIYEGPLQSLKHHKKDVQSIKSGMECGLSFGDRFKEVQIGDSIQCLRQVELPPVFD